MVGPGWPWPPVSATWFEHLVRAFDCAFLEKCAQAAPCWVDLADGLVEGPGLWWGLGGASSWGWLFGAPSGGLVADLGWCGL